MKSKILSIFSSFKAKLDVFRNKISSFYSFVKGKKMLVSLFSLFFITGILALATYYVRFRQNTSPAQASGVKLGFASVLGSTSSGYNVDVSVLIETNGLSVTGSDLTIKYDPSVLHATSIQQGDFLPVVFSAGQITEDLPSKNGTAKIILGCNPTTPKSGAGILVTVKFNIINLQAAVTTIYIDPGTAVTVLGQTANAWLAPTSLVLSLLVPSATPTPTVTSTPTAVPTVSPTATPKTACKGISYTLSKSTPLANTTVKVDINKSNATSCNGSWQNVGLLLDGKLQTLGLCYADGSHCSNGYHALINSGGSGSHTLQFTADNGTCLCNTKTFTTK